MVLRPIFFTLVALALLGDARIFLFVLNRFVFGAHKEEQSPWRWLIWVMPPVLLALTALFWPLNRWINLALESNIVGRITPQRLEDVAWSLVLAKIGSMWLFIAASVGMYWIVDRLRSLHLGPTKVANTRSDQPEVVRLRKAHVPFAFLRNLGAHNDVYDIEVTKHEVFIEDLEDAFDGYRVAFLTDTHVASFMRRKFYRECVAQVEKFDADLVLLGGDFVTFKRDIPLMGEVLLTGLTAKDGVYAVLGNHDYWAGGDRVKATLEEKGVQLIINRSVRLQRGGTFINLVGIDEIYRGDPDVEAAFAGVDPRTPCLGLSHHPDVIDLLERRRIDLLVCGHTHGGQIRFPFFGAVVVPSRYEGRYAAGFRREGSVLMYVSRGIGSIPPLRILCRPEVATFVLRQSRRT